MRKKIVAGNWKMNLTLSEAEALVTEVVSQRNALATNVNVIFGAPFPYLLALNGKLNNTNNCAMAAQNCSEHASGAYTGEVSAGMIGQCGVEYIILGHSERRSFYGDSHDVISQKIIRALDNNLKVIFCCGESLQQREQLKLYNVVEAQLWDSLFHLDDEQIANCIIAYEPVWAIGTGVTASAEQAQEMHLFIRNTIAEKYGDSIAQSTHLLYGGSCNEKNAKELFSMPDIDGGLIGGASLKADSFLKILNSF